MVKKILASVGAAVCILCGLLLFLAAPQKIASPTEGSPEQSSSSTDSTSAVTTVTTAPSSESATELTTLTTQTTAAPTTQTTYTPASGRIFVWDSASGQLLYSKGDTDGKVYPASITKLFSIYVALQYLHPETEVTVGQEVKLVDPDSSLAYISPGNRLTVAMLVEGMLLPSGNDAAYALAAATGYALAQGEALTPAQAVARFVEEMNLQAQALGLTGTHFVTPDGTHHDDHYTTPADLLQIAQLVVQLPLVRQYAGLKEDTVTFLSGQRRSWVNTNALLDPASEYYCSAAIGLKTGYETTAGHCLLSAFAKEDGYVFVLVMRAPNTNARFADTLWAYENYGK